MRAVGSTVGDGIGKLVGAGPGNRVGVIVGTGDGGVDGSGGVALALASRHSCPDASWGARCVAAGDVFDEVAAYDTQPAIAGAASACLVNIFAFLNAQPAQSEQMIAVIRKRIQSDSPVLGACQDCPFQYFRADERI